MKKEITFSKLLKEVPKDVRDFILVKQTGIEIKSNITFSFEKTLYKLIRSHPEFIATQTK